MRKTWDELKQIMKEVGTDKLWSWSKINCFKNSWYEYYLKYIAKAKEDRANSIYTTTGGIVHSILEDFYTGKIKYEQMDENFEDGWTTAFDIAQLKFDRNNEEHNDKIADKYYNDLKHFFANHVPMKNKVVIEQFIKTMIGDNLFQGYIDACFKDDDGNINIIDFKTSSIYKGKKAENECGQLVVYALGMNQLGVPIDKIKIAWNFLKYVSVQVTQANGTVKIREIERAELGEKLQANAKTWLKKCCNSVDEVDEYLKMLLDTNDIKCLPEEVQKKYVISDCYVYVPLTDDLIKKWTDDILLNIKDIELREKDYTKRKAEGLSEVDCSRAFWDSDETVEKNSFYFSTLCAYSPTLHLPYKAYLDRLEQQKNGEDTFGGLGGFDSDSSTVVEGVSTTNNQHSISQNDESSEIDLSWLDNL